ncbi:DUF3280 domain-containing protein [Bradyrhizobium sp.]|uniref:DUF3280 domain-containing protein n=1 Tax=Bradyrhizobium sp. TaxID=376 RepID=UPI00260946EF|nr:DUF3280 domain-containing protein [Bradyrhizobium sp.]
MRAFIVFALLLMPIGSAPTRAADPPRLAVFDLEMLDTSLQGQMNGPRADEQERLLRAGDQLRKELGESGKFRIVDIAPVNVAAHQSNLQACGGCDVKLAQQLNADLEMTGLVQKVSNLILNINLYLRDVHTGRLVTAASADMRGNTDESWSRTMRYLIHERLLAPNYGAPAAR